MRHLLAMPFVLIGSAFGLLALGLSAIGMGFIRAGGFVAGDKGEVPFS